MLDVLPKWYKAHYLRCNLLILFLTFGKVRIESQIKSDFSARDTNKHLGVLLDLQFFQLSSTTQEVPSCTSDLSPLRWLS